MRTTRRSAARAPGERGHDRFARAVDSGVREASDHTMDRELAVVAALREAGDAAGPTRDEVDRMRSRVMAGAASIDRDAGSGDRVTPMPSHGGTPRRGGRHAKRASVTAEARGRLIVAAAAALCLLLSLSGTSLLLSRDALPGDALYAFKRSAESAELGLTFGEQSRALKHLEFATARITEIERMAAAADADDSWGSGTAQFLAALDDFDSDTIAGTRLLTGVAVGGDVGILSSLQGWADQQQDRLDDVRAALPAEAGGRITSSLALLDQVQQRAEALQDRADCRNMTSGASDDLGPVPAEEPCVPGRLDDAASAEPLVLAPKTAAPATPDGSATVPSTQPPAEQAAQDGKRVPEPPGLRDIFPNGDREDPGDGWPDRDGKPWWPDGDDSPRDPRDPLVVPLPLLPDIPVPPPGPDGSEPR